MSSLCEHDDDRERDYKCSQIEHTQCLPCDKKNINKTKRVLRKKQSSLNYQDISDTEIDQKFFSSQMDGNEEESEIDENDSSISDESFSSLNENESQFMYPKFPISFQRDEFSHLNDKNWLKFQCILLWDYCKDQKLNLTPTQSHFLYINSEKDKNMLNLEEIKNLHADFITSKILAKHFFLSTSNTKKQSINIHENLNPIINNIILFHQDYPHLSLIDILEQCVLKLNENNSEFVKESFFHPLMLKFSVEAIKSASQVLKMLNYEDKMSFEEKNQHKHLLLFSILFHNSSLIDVNDLQNFFEISEYLIQKSLAHIQKFKLGDASSFKIERKPRVIFTPETFKLIQQFYEQHTQQWEGKRMVSHLKNDGTSETHHVHFIPTTKREFYLLFRVHEEFGMKCKTINGKFDAPSKSLFFRLMPYWIRKHPKIGSGFCGHCLKMREFLKTFVQILKKNCKCGSVNCPTFDHEPKCDGSLISGDGKCLECRKCCCKQCDKCKSSTLDLSLTKFMQNLHCREHRIGGLDYPKIECLLNPRECECQTCCLPNFQSLVNKFCPSAMKNLDQNCTVTTKDWKKEKIEKKKAFVIENLEPVELNIIDFLTQFHYFLVIRILKKQPGSFIWHWSGENLQRHNYNKTIQKIQKGEFGESVMMYVCDWGENWLMKDSRKISAKEFFKNKACQLHCIVEFGHYKDDFQSCSNFIFSDQIVGKNSIISVDDLKNMIELGKEKNPALEVAVIYSDGANNEYMNCKVFGKMKEVAISLKLCIIWNYFFSGHGKGIGDSEISRQKVALDDKFPDSCYERDENGKLKYKKNALGVVNICKDKLKNWTCNGCQIKSRNFHHRKEGVVEKENFKTVVDTKRLRNVMWDKNGNFYTKHVSCNCISCIVNPLLAPPCEYASLTESFKLTKIKTKISRTKISKTKIPTTKISKT